MSQIVEREEKDMISSRLLIMPNDLTILISIEQQSLQYEIIEDGGINDVERDYYFLNDNGKDEVQVMVEDIYDGGLNQI